MGENSKIEWTDHTWNPWVGCTKVSPACEHCYMFMGMKRTGQDPKHVRKTVAKPFPLKRDRQRQFKVKPGEKVFTCSWSDWFHEAADEWRPAAWDVIRQRPDVTFQIVTKRIERAADCLPPDWGDGWPNVWLIVTAENQQWMEQRAFHLKEIPAVVRGLSIEPLLGPVVPKVRREECKVCGNIAGAHGVIEHGRGCYTQSEDGGGLSYGDPGIDWVIVGGESGPHARPMHPDWVRSIRNRCQAAGVAFFFKQWGAWVPSDQYPDALNGVRLSRYEKHTFPDGQHVFRVGKELAGRTLDGREWSEFPTAGVE